jgi:site-specific DNA recombinase
MSTKRLRAAYYARYSTDGQQADSIDRQFMVCEAVASREGFTHEPRYRFSDPELSGGSVRRPGYMAMLTAARNREFDVLIAEDISRLWRNMEMQTRDINELEELRIPVVTQTEDTRRENDRMMLNLKGSINESYRKDIGRRVRNKQHLLARNRRPAGGRAYGYIPASRSSSGQIEKNEAEAEVVRQIFTWRAEGWSGKRIALELNARQIPAPGATWNRRQSIFNAKRTNGEWVRSAIVGDVRRGTGILNNPLYKGDVIWGRSHWERSPRDSSIRRWELVDDPMQHVAYHEARLQIVSNELWTLVRAVQTARTPRGEAIRGALRQRGRGPVHWLSSLLICAECGSNYVQYGRTDYICGGHHNGSNCRNGARFRMTDAESAVLSAITYDFASPAAIERAVNTAMDCYEREHAHITQSVPAKSVSLADIDARESQVREEYKAGKLPSVVFTAWLAELERERAARTVPSVPKVRRVTREEFARAYRGMVATRLDVLTKRENAAAAREGLRQLLVNGRIVLRPNVEREQFEGTAAFDARQFLVENQLDIKMVAGAGFEPATFGL